MSVSRLCVEGNAQISKVIEILNNEFERIVLVVDENNRLQGTVTDGDIRRGLLNQIGVDDTAAKIMNKNPRTVKVGTDNEKIIEFLEKERLLQAPLITEDGFLYGIETLRHLKQKKRIDNPVVLMAGGFGKRLRPLTADTPKPLLNVGNKPILELILDNFLKAGFYRFYISTHYKSEQVELYFGNGENWSVEINYVHEREPLGTAGTLGLLPDDFPDLPVILMNGDLLTKVNFNRLLEYHQEAGDIATMCVREYDLQVPYGVVYPDGNKIKEIIEKPMQRFFVNAGIYVLNSEIRQQVEPGKYLDMPDLLQGQIHKGESVNMFPLHEYWLDIGKLEDFNKAQNDIGEIE